MIFAAINGVHCDEDGRRRPKATRDFSGDVGLLAGSLGKMCSLLCLFSAFGVGRLHCCSPAPPMNHANKMDASAMLIEHDGACGLTCQQHPIDLLGTMLVQSIPESIL